MKNLEAIDALAARFFDEYLRRQIDALGALAADPARIEVFRSAGGSSALFSEEDLRAIYLTIERFRDLDRHEVFRLTRRLLVMMNLWDPAALPGSQGPRWSDRSLACLFDSKFPSDALIRAATRELVSLDQRFAAASKHLRFARSLLIVPPRHDAGGDPVRKSRRISAADIERATEAPPPRPLKVSVQIRRRKGNGVCQTTTNSA